MKTLLVLVVTTLGLLSVGCSVTEDTVYRTPIPIETLSAYKEGAPINNRLDAVIVGQRILWSSRISYVDEIEVVFVEQMSLTQALKRIERTGPNWTKLSGDSKVWLVVFEGEWQLLFPPPSASDLHPTLEPPYHGCRYSLFTANDGSYLAGGGILCPSEE